MMEKSGLQRNTKRGPNMKVLFLDVDGVLNTPVLFNRPLRYEIKRWLEDHPEVTTFAIVDDDSDASIDGHFV